MNNGRGISLNSEIIVVEFKEKGVFLCKKNMCYFHILIVLHPLCF